jgi:hypothetical protein
MSQNPPENVPEVASHGLFGLSFEEFCADPMCQKCNTSMSLNPECEWPEDPRLWLCMSCMTDLAELLLPPLPDTSAKCPDCYGSGFEEIDHGHYPCRRGCLPNSELNPK